MKTVTAKEWNDDQQQAADVCMTLDQQIQVWNAVGTWLAGIATFLAVVVSLYLARKSESINLKVNVGIRLVFAGDGTPAEEHVGFNVVNIGDRQVNILSVGWSVGKKNKRYCIQPIKGQYTEQYPKWLTHGEGASFLHSFKDSPNWTADFASGFVQDTSDRNLKTLRALNHTSIGKTLEVVPEKNLLERLQAINTKGAGDARL